jgi:2-polyprenyl-3-methyl-5-hydroxy-6-metoxy-1,4-benzoquinol methylase
MEHDFSFLEKNKSLWDQRTEWHVQSAMYDVPAFLQGESKLNDIELNLAGNVAGKSLLHLQCHFGLDTLSFARMGAKVTGIDFSMKAIEKANQVAEQAGLEADFVLSDVYSLKENLHGQFDIVFTSYGVIGWLPDLDQWAGIISHFLKPGGVFIMAEFHPVVWMYDNDFTKVQYSYFKDEPIVEMEEGTYADKNAPIKAESISWNHSLAEVFTALLKQGLAITNFEEFNYSPYNCFSHTEQIAPKKFIIKPFGDKIPLVYAIRAVKS